MNHRPLATLPNGSSLAAPTVDWWRLGACSFGATMNLPRPLQPQTLLWDAKRLCLFTGVHGPHADYWEQQALRFFRGLWMRFSPQDIAEHPVFFRRLLSCPGVYAFLGNHGLHYVGTSDDLGKRLRCHLRHGSGVLARLPLDSAWLCACRKEKRSFGRLTSEARIIARFQPRLNKRIG